MRWCFSYTKICRDHCHTSQSLTEMSLYEARRCPFNFHLYFVEPCSSFKCKVQICSSEKPPQTTRVQAGFPWQPVLTVQGHLLFLLLSHHLPGDPQATVSHCQVTPIRIIFSDIQGGSFGVHFYFFKEYILAHRNSEMTQQPETKKYVQIKLAQIHHSWKTLLSRRRNKTCITCKGNNKNLLLVAFNYSIQMLHFDDLTRFYSYVFFQICLHIIPQIT